MRTPRKSAFSLQRLPWYDSPTAPWNNAYRWNGRAVTSWQPQHRGSRK
ncbi:MAG: hypothetical protein IJM12_06695 [Bacteroidales bacterium]|nr:hypothetical protein [Bacteroidales bacterium]